MKYNLLKHISYLNTTCLTHFHIIHVLKDQHTILLNQSISISTQALATDILRSNPICNSMWYHVNEKSRWVSRST